METIGRTPKDIVHLKGKLSVHSFLLAVEIQKEPALKQKKLHARVLLGAQGRN